MRRERKRSRTASPTAAHLRAHWINIRELFSSTVCCWMCKVRHMRRIHLRTSPTWRGMYKSTLYSFINLNSTGLGKKMLVFILWSSWDCVCKWRDTSLLQFAVMEKNNGNSRSKKQKRDDARQRVLILSLIKAFSEGTELFVALPVITWALENDMSAHSQTHTHTHNLYFLWKASFIFPMDRN